MELAGVEPASGQSATAPSTCLVSDWFFECGLVQKRTHPHLILCVSPSGRDIPSGNSAFFWCVTAYVADIKAKSGSLGEPLTRRKSFLVPRTRQPWHTECCQLLFSRCLLRSNRLCSGMLTKRLHFPVNTRQPQVEWWMMSDERWMVITYGFIGCLACFATGLCTIVEQESMNSCKGKPKAGRKGSERGIKCFVNGGGEDLSGQKQESCRIFR